ncbi:ABC transporter permease [Paraglaciecola arctica]|uniref:Ribose transport system permease protein n=1 Tax=Paraglaciecola arctica BSs20135 TaxID=493475 RepID=K6YB52_9ALTE|nr:ABC transporter permease [Paraglaciecola arctica]GAC21186.1 ribose transport system permease protein [Paraglaciecola arctica BSs20135]
MSTTTSSLTRSDWAARLLKPQYFIYYMFMLVLAGFALFLNDTGFFSLANFMNIVRQTAPITIMAVGLSFALAVGHIDLSIGSVVALSAIVGAILLQYVGVPLAIAGALLSGVLVGLINGFLIERLKVSSLLITLGTMGIITGISRQVSGLESIPIIDPLFRSLLGNGDLLGVPVLLWWTLSFALIGYLVMNKLVFGRHLLAVGGNPEAARAMGLRTENIRIKALVMCSLCAAIAGLLYAGRMAGARYTLGEADLLTVIAAVAIGGTSLFGGRVSIIGAVIGSWLMGLINNGLILSGFSTDEQMITRGLILITAVAIGAREAKNA